MKILFTGHGSGGHFYPIIAVAEEIHQVIRERKFVKPKLYYIAPSPYDGRLLFENDIIWRRSIAGKMRRYFSIKNFFDLFKTAIGVIQSLVQLFIIYPDVVFSKGGYASVPVVFAARFLRIPIFVHESDAIPGRANLWAAKFANRVAVSYPDAKEHFSKVKADVVYIGNPVRKGISIPARHGAHEFLKLDPGVPTILILGGSQGAQKINDIILTALPDLVKQYQIIHQTGEKNIKELETTANVVLEGDEFKDRYKAFGYLNDLALRMAAGVADIIISRAGSGSIFEIAMWEKPSIIIPIPESVSKDQRKNAFSYARSGGAIVIEEKNLASHVLTSEINRLMGNASLRQKMAEGARSFKKPDAARKLAEELIAVALEHES